MVEDWLIGVACGIRVNEQGVDSHPPYTHALPISVPPFKHAPQTAAGAVRGSRSALTTNSVDLLYGIPYFNSEATLRYIHELVCYLEVGGFNL